VFQYLEKKRMGKLLILSPFMNAGEQVNRIKCLLKKIM